MRERIGPYRIERVLADRGMSVVYLGHHETLLRPAAIKTLLPKDAADSVSRDRFLREAQAQALLNHPNIVPVYDLIDENGELFIAMEYVEGGTLAKLLERQPRSRMTIQDALPIVVQILNALDHVHRQKIIHRDVKPSNIMISGGVAKLADFGIVLLSGMPRLTASQHVIGSPPWMSPEQLQGHGIDHRTDIYSAALVLHRMLSGRSAFEAKDLAQIHELLAGPPDLRTIVAGVPIGVCQALSIALSCDPDHRFPSALRFRDALDEGAAGLLPQLQAGAEAAAASSEAPTEPLMPAPENDGHDHRAPIAGALLGGLLLVGSYGLLSRSGRTPAPPAIPQPMASAALVSPPSATETAPARPSHRSDQDPPPVPVASAREEARKALAPITPAQQIDPAEEAAKRLRELEQLREEIRLGLLHVEEAIRNERLDPASDELDRIALKTQLHPDDLREEHDEVARLRGLIAQTQVDRRTRREQDQIWASRIAAIEEDVHQEHWPEAERFAKGIVDDHSAPTDIVTRARELLQKAQEGRRDSFRETQLGPTSNTIRKPSSPPRKNR